MVFVFFIYGLSFFILGFSVLIFPKKGSAFNLAHYLWLIGGFGLLHGINEWLDMFILIRDFGGSFRLEHIRMVTLAGSFLFLVNFGCTLLNKSRSKTSLYRYYPVLLFFSWAIIFAASERRFLMGDIWARYLLCFPGAFLTGCALIRQLPQLEKAKQPVVIKNLKRAAGVFFLYGIFAGLIVKKADFFPASLLNYDLFQDRMGIPVQIFRAVCAIILTYSTLRVLSIFHWEKQNALEEREFRVHAVTSSAPVILFMADKECRLTFIEGKGLDDLGLNSSRVLGRNVAEVFGETPQVKEDCRRTLENREIFSGINIKDKLFESCYSPIRDRTGMVTGLIGVAVDVTRHMKIQAELENYRDELVKSRYLSELGTVSAVMAEQLNEPLSVAQLLLQRLAADVAAHAESEALSNSVQKGLAEISKSILILDSFRKTAAAEQIAEAGPVDIYLLVKRMMSVFSDSARRANLQIIGKGVDAVPRLFIPIRDLEQLFFIVIQNAIDAADSSKAERLTISYERESNWSHFIFVDNCRGIAEEILAHIFFCPFPVRGQEGARSGMGLAIARQIVSYYGGNIEIESKAGKGTAVKITLPAA